MNDVLLKLQIGPVQDFIAQARSTRDLWSGSYLLSWLMAAGLQSLESNGVKIIYPAWENQPLRKLRSSQTVSFDQARVPNLPNIVLARINNSEPLDLARTVENTIRAEWMRIAERVWQFGIEHNGPFPWAQERFREQAARFLSISWQVTSGEPHGFESNWSAWTRTIGRDLDAVRQVRNFRGWFSKAGPGNWADNKDSLTGREEAVAGGPGWRDTLRPPLESLFKHNDWIGAITFIKRTWHLAYLPDYGFQRDHFKMPNTLGVAAHDPFAIKHTEQHDEDEADSVDNLPDPDAGRYFAVIALDGDQIGPKVNKIASMEEHQEFSKSLARFASGNIQQLVTKQDGRIIYAGGDDVVALLPADTALPCAQSLRTEFQRVMGDALDVSAGIAIAHYKNPLQDVIRAAQSAQERAKGKKGQTGLNRQAVAVTLCKRSGETVEWGTKWNSGGLELYNLVVQGMASGKLSRKFPHNVIALLRPYLNSSTPLEKSRSGTATKTYPEFKAAEITRLEFSHAAGRQRGRALSDDKEARASFASELERSLNDYLTYLQSRSSDEQLQAVIGLCETAAFFDAPISSEVNVAEVQP